MNSKSVHTWHGIFQGKPESISKRGYNKVFKLSFLPSSKIDSGLFSSPQLQLLSIFSLIFFISMLLFVLSEIFIPTPFTLGYLCYPFNCSLEYFFTSCSQVNLILSNVPYSLSSLPILNLLELWYTENSQYTHTHHILRSQTVNGLLQRMMSSQLLAFLPCTSW